MRYLAKVSNCQKLYGDVEKDVLQIDIQVHTDR